MKTYSKFAIVLLLIFTLPCLWAQGIQEFSEPIPNVSFSRGTKDVYGEVKVVDLHGTWYEMGQQYGYLMKEELKEVYDFVEAIAGVSEENATNATAITRQQELQTPYRICQPGISSLLIDTTILKEQQNGQKLSDLHMSHLIKKRLNKNKF
ncbi:MAG: hypothetical protein K6G51_04480 [Sphaerochaetaceae bacterium]|nr:hypothetical protein [Sphaerochaetaceae bacterium]